MQLTPDEEARTVISRRTFPAPRAVVFDAYANPKKLVRWWGPRGFSLTTETLDLVVGGEWRFVLHGPEGKDYKNLIRFEAIEKPSRFVVRHDCGPYYTGTVLFDEVPPGTPVANGLRTDAGGGTAVTMVWTFDNPAVFEKIKDLVAEGNEGNFDRLWDVVAESLVA